MKSFKTSVSKICAAVGMAASMAAVAPASAEVIQLGFILDGSGSIGASNWTTIVNGLSSAINTLIPVGGANTYEVSVVSFGSSANISINSYTVNDAAQRTTLAGLVSGLTFLNGGSTNYAAAFSAMQTALTDGVGTNGNIVAGAGTKSYVNFATDGAANAGGGGGLTANQAGIAARNNLITAGVDNISIEGIGINATGANNLQTNYCYPVACDATSPYDFPNKGFYIGVANAQGYADAIGNKIAIVTGQVPEPGTLALLGIALAGLGFTRRKKVS